MGRLFRPFTLTACNPRGRRGAVALTARLFTSQLHGCSSSPRPGVRATSVSARRQIQAQIIDPYADRGVRVVRLLVQNTDGSAISPTTCRGWVSRCGITFPELMDPMFIHSPFVPMTAFPASVIIDRCGPSLAPVRLGDQAHLDPRRRHRRSRSPTRAYPNCPAAGRPRRRSIRLAPSATDPPSSCAPARKINRDVSRPA
ncbi:MAG: hypothetical protein IPF99_09290 [Deltaproteobacteria bacterium]|nr:hypothetical protein [Deltaproteobacteria bacterium]